MTVKEILAEHLRSWSPEQILIFLLIVIVCNVWLNFCVRTGRIRRRQIPSILFLEFYMALVYSSTVFTRQTVGTRWMLEPLAGWKAALMQHSASAMTEGVLNIILFVPIGWLLVTACHRFCKTSRLIFYGFAFSLSIELSQFVFQCGISSVDDLINNTLGCILGILTRRIVQDILENDG